MEKVTPDDTARTARCCGYPPRPHCHPRPHPGKRTGRKIDAEAHQESSSPVSRERESCPRKEKKILRANPRTPGSAISVTAMSRPRPPNTSPGPRPRQLLGDGRADPEMRDWGGDAVRYCVFAWCRRRALPCRLYVASGRASGTRTASRPRVSWSQSKRAAPGTDTDRQPCVPAVSRARADDDRRNELRRERFYFAWRLAPPRKMKKKEKKGRDYSTVIARPV